MKYAVIRHVLPDGSIAGYHADSLCNIHLNAGSAKHYPFRTPEKNDEQLAIVRRNFENLWEEHRKRSADDASTQLKCYTKWEGWKGYNLHEIQTEFVPIMIITETIKYLFELEKKKRLDSEAIQYRMKYLQTLLEDPDGDDLEQAKRIVAEHEQKRIENKQRFMEKARKILDAL